jgi:stearoyl-CoA desaturase (delta-9 desaturase)
MFTTIADMYTKYTPRSDSSVFFFIRTLPITLDADPHNIKRGLMFSHGFWLFKKRHPANFIKSSTLDATELMSDPLVVINHKYFDLLFIVFGMILPTATGYFLTSAPLVHCFMICYVIKHVMVMQVASLLNSAAHLFGDKPYNHKIMAGDDSLMAKFTLGEGFHK